MPDRPKTGGELRAVLARIARRAIADCHGGTLVERALGAPAGSAPAPARRFVVVGAGKAVSAMAEGALRALGPGCTFGPLLG